MINRNPILAFVLTLVMAAYLVVSLRATADFAAADTLTGCNIVVADSLHTGFVTADDISRECGDLLSPAGRCRRDSINIGALESRLAASDQIESVNVQLLNNGALLIDVTPMVPVARVFDTNDSYYINAGGKRITADPRYHVDVPVVVGYFPANRPAVRLLPLLDYIASHRDLDALVSTVKQDRNGDIIIVPTIRGHVINFGDTSRVEDKFMRLTAFYRNVMPVRGWETYDTLAVKWNGRVVATRRDKRLAGSTLASVIEEYDDIDDHDTMTTPLHTDTTTIE